MASKKNKKPTKKKSSPKSTPKKAKAMKKPSKASKSAGKATKTVVKIITKTVAKIAAKITSKTTGKLSDKKLNGKMTAEQAKLLTKAQLTKGIKEPKAPRVAKVVNREEKIRQVREAIRAGTMKPGKIAALKEELGAVEIGICREGGCELTASTKIYCRLHYIKNWKVVKRKEDILKDGRLNEYVDELIAKYPDKYIEIIRHDLSTDKDFAKIIADLEIDEGVEDIADVDAESDTENEEAVIESIRRDFDTEGSFEEGDF